MKHYLKTHPEPFQAIVEGRKSFEHRCNDRDFQTGDTVILTEWKEGKYTGRVIPMRVGYLLREGEFGVAPRHCVFQLVSL